MLIGTRVVWILSAIGAAVIGVVATQGGGQAGGSVVTILIGMTVLGPLAAIFSVNWWVFVLNLVGAGLALFLFAIFAIELSGAAEVMGPAGIIFMAPMLIFPAALVVSGILRLGVQLIRQLRGDFGTHEFVPRPVAIVLLIGIGALIATGGYWGYAFYMEGQWDREGRERAATLNLAGLEGLAGRVPVVDGRGILQIWNRSRSTWTAIEISYRVDGGPTQVLEHPLDQSVRPDESAFVFVRAGIDGAQSIDWTVTRVDGY